MKKLYNDPQVDILELVGATICGSPGPGPQDPGPTQGEGMAPSRANLIVK